MASGLGIGIDVAKDKIDVASSDGRLSEVVPQTPEALAALARRLAELEPLRVLLEASGGYEADVLMALHDAELPILLIEPSRARDYARGVGQRAKTDAIDARVLADMSLSLIDRSPLWKPVSSEVGALRQLVHRRHQLLVQLDAETKRRRGANDWVLASLERSRAFHKAELAEVEAEIRRLIENTADLAASVACLEEVKGVGRTTAATLLATLPELGSLGRKAITALAGLAPHNRESGRWQGRARISGGRVRARCALYMAALSAIRFNAEIKAFYEHLRGRGKPKMMALTACMRKLLIHLNSRMRRHRMAAPQTA